MKAMKPLVPPMFGVIPLLVYIVMTFAGFHPLVATVGGLVLAAIFSGQTLLSTAQAIQAGLGSFLALVGLIIMFGGGLGEVLRRTGAAGVMVRWIMRRLRVDTPGKAVVGSMFTSFVMVAALGTLAGANSMIAPVLIPIVAAVGLTPSTLSVILHGAGATGLFLGPFTPPMVTLMKFSGLSYGQVVLYAGLPMSVVMWLVTYFMARWVQRRTAGKYAYGPEDMGGDAGDANPRAKRAAIGFAITMVTLIAYGIAIKGGATFALMVMLLSGIITGLVGGLRTVEITEAFAAGAGRLVWLFFLFVLFDPFTRFIGDMGTYKAITEALAPAAAHAGRAGFYLIAALVGMLGIPGAAVAQVKVVHEMFSGLVTQMGIPMTAWVLVLLYASQLDFFAVPTGDMIGEMGIARSKDLRSLILNGFAITAAATLVMVIRALTL